MSAFIWLNFDEFEAIKAPDNEILWEGLIDIKEGRFEGQQTINILTKDRVVSNESKEFIESKLAQIETLLQEGLAFVKTRFKEDPAAFNILDHEHAYLDLPLDEFPLDQPNLNFYCDCDEWSVRFGEGKFNICDPYGLLVTFLGNTPIRAEDPSEFEFIDLE